MPTLTETGITKYEAEIFYGLVAPAKTPPDALMQLSDWFATALNAPEIQIKLVQQGLFKVGTCGAPLGDFLRNITADYERVTQAAGMKTN